ncbi:MAG: NADP-dependent isocitrate dehydrogenase [Thermoanaerobaculia bacterium]|nr:NADP-dependent isocitrate dehydrogenase [Thermoanaerobaculia bacterium]
MRWDSLGEFCALVPSFEHIAATFANPQAEIHLTQIQDRVPLYLIGNDFYFDRKGFYGEDGADYPDNASRFIFFCRATLELCKAIGFKPDIIHCHDWQTGLVAALGGQPLGLTRLPQQQPAHQHRQQDDRHVEQHGQTEAPRHPLDRGEERAPIGASHQAPIDRRIPTLCSHGDARHLLRGLGQDRLRRRQEAHPLTPFGDDQA